MHTPSTSSPLGITLGCPASIGPELILKLYKDYLLPSNRRIVVLGNRNILEYYTSLFAWDIPIHSWQPGHPIDSDVLHVYEVDSFPIEQLQPGHPNIHTGKIMAQYIETGISLCQQNIFSGLVTCPICKETLNQAGYDYPGHTEMLATVTKTPHYGMMLAGPKLRVTLVTIHCPFHTIPEKLSVSRIIDTIQLTHDSLTGDFGINSPRIGIAALNPHAGENGLFGDEETRIIQPAAKHCRQQGLDVSDPLPADTIYHSAANGHYDAIVSMYHDQGLIPFKLLHFSDGVNITMGLPIVRTSVDHGTAYDIAGKNIADPQSLLAAIEAAHLISANRKKRITTSNN